MKVLHSYWAYIVVGILIYTVVNAIVGLVQKKEFTHKEFRLGLFSLITTHIQLLLGFVVYFMGGFQGGLSQMKDAPVRLLALEHPLMMIIAIVLITVGWSKHKKQVKSEDKFKTFAIFYGIALLLILSRIPWSNWI
ncbi:hypothetical protein [Tenacibaculum piscium]|uniref:hypothetical protein n=1 Tax=Tenacibaculum piscium TaxID=1458515 RepID=UPI000C7AD08E|nr:hypothetical protein [Tenacibaculum piscium]MBE7671261.1 hypothetical protein [Tenacibaculum piscium]MBE7686248.1 hypothetical protein [Tenacibaculum piscium]MBE7689982.1 hypothetical protein [Tenacibaculum piscium]